MIGKNIFLPMFVKNADRMSQKISGHVFICSSRYFVYKMAAAGVKSVSFEVYGKVQGVFFRKHTQAQAKKLGLSGWVQNTSTGTVVGCIEGSEDKVKIMKRWLQETGSPRSRIDKCIFKDEKDITAKASGTFAIKK